MVTGGSQGLGESMGVEFAKRGADVVLVSRSEEKLKLALQKVEVLSHTTDANVGCESLTRANIHIL